MPEQSDERRRFHRIATDKPVVIRADGVQHTGIVLDVSLRGLLFAVSDGWRPQHGTQAQVRLRLGGDDCCIDMHGAIAHVDGDHIGLHCSAIDLDSASRLRRMVELNLADRELLERDLAQLIAD
ncbi:MAG: PilZ domain-containing protein [Chromatiaceae bacterium]|jgi:hypothetical protein|nr:PilZ domain-containing protein [Chromatiaceae bacterium]